MSNYTNLLANKSGATYVEYGYGQVEPNHLSAQRNGQIYAQLPADKDIEVLENGQFVKYDYKEGVVNYTGAGEWMLVFNEIKLYRDGQRDCEFAMIKDNYNARVYSPSNGEVTMNKQSRYYGKILKANIPEDKQDEYTYDEDGVYAVGIKVGENTYPIEKVTLNNDPYELHYNDDPFHIYSRMEAQMMPEGTTMVPRVFKTMIGDIFTTNTIKETTLAVGNLLKVGADGYLVKVGDNDEDNDMQWQVVKVYTMPDGQKGVKIMRIK